MVIIDNATVHRGDYSFPVLQDLLEAHGVHLIFLPKYSPELNPCELVVIIHQDNLLFHSEVEDGEMRDWGGDQGSWSGYPKWTGTLPKKRRKPLRCIIFKEHIALGTNPDMVDLRGFLHEWHYPFRFYSYSVHWIGI